MDTAETLVRYLQRGGYEVETIERNPNQAVEKFKDAHQQGKGYELIITSLQMEGEPDGIGLIQEFKAITDDVAVIVFTGFDDLNFELDALQKGAADYIVKRAPEIILERVRLSVENLRRARIVARIGASEQEVTVLFADLEGFAPRAEQMPLVDVADLVDNSLTTMSERIYVHDGIVNNFIGDEVFAIFEDESARHNERENHAVRAVKAALEIREQVQTEVLKIHIGVATGHAILGSFGPLRRRQYTVLGPTVNLASRLCSATEGGQIFISERTDQAFDPPGLFKNGRWRRRTLKGLGKVRFREVLGVKEEF
jgi:class 3 adenylate cyclase